MDLIIIRHGDPDYEHDTLTEHGWKEAEILSHRISQLNVRDFYVSPLGRAQDTASCTLKVMNRTATTLDWLQEFPARVYLDQNEHLLEAYPDRQIRDGRLTANVSWDILPSYLWSHPEYFHPTEWRNSEIVKAGDFLSVYDHVIQKFDRLLSSYGYVRENGIYKVTRSNRDTIVFFCHFRTGMCLVVSSDGDFPIYFMAYYCICTDLCDNHSFRRKRTGHCLFSCCTVGGYFSSVGCWP